MNVLFLNKPGIKMNTSTTQTISNSMDRLSYGLLYQSIEQLFSLDGQNKPNSNETHQPLLIISQNGSGDFVINRSLDNPSEWTAIVIKKPTLADELRLCSSSDPLVAQEAKKRVKLAFKQDKITINDLFEAFSENVDSTSKVYEWLAYKFSSRPSTVQWFTKRMNRNLPIELSGALYKFWDSATPNYDAIVGFIKASDTDDTTYVLELMDHYRFKK